MKAKMYIAKNGFAYRASEDGQSVQFLDTTMHAGWKRSDYMTGKVLKAARPAQEVLDEEAARRGWQPWEEPEEQADKAQCNAVQLAEDVLSAVKHFKGELTADGCRQAVGKSYFSHSGLDTGGYQCSPRGVKLAPKGEDFMDLTWAKFIKFCRENGLIEEESIKCNMKPAQKPAAAANSPPEDASPQISPTGCTSAPASPADAGAAAQSLSAAAPASLEAQPLASSAFDYTGLDQPTVDTLHWAEREICDARRDYVARLAQAVHIAHDALCGSCDKLSQLKHGNRGEESFGAWCAYVGISRKTGERLLQVAALLKGSTPEEQAVLEAASPSLLYAAAKPSAPAQLVQAVKDGDITTHKQYQELLARLKAKDQELASERADREAERASTSALLADEQQRRQEANEARIAAEKAAQGAKESYSIAQKNEALAIRRAKEAEKALAGARDALTAAKARGDRWQEKCEALAAQAAAPAIEARVVDPEEVEQLAAEKAEALAAQQMAQRDAEDARAAYDAVILATRSMDAAWQALAPMLPRLAPEEKGQAIRQFVNKLMCIKEDVLKCL